MALKMHQLQSGLAGSSAAAKDAEAATRIAAMALDGASSSFDSAVKQLRARQVTVTATQTDGPQDRPRHRTCIPDSVSPTAARCGMGISAASGEASRGLDEAGLSIDEGPWRDEELSVSLAGAEPSAEGNGDENIVSPWQRIYRVPNTHEQPMDACREDRPAVPSLFRTPPPRVASRATPDARCSAAEGCQIAPSLPRNESTMASTRHSPPPMRSPLFLDEFGVFC